ncbi:MAG: succinylglutamate desuccinylase/aspartoacylase family protein, partial [Bacteroidales bacterium]|nr:succinylglutamate desuccinylase/aspartoacylase family protein [Bacteroidales bacterium]
MKKISIIFLLLIFTFSAFSQDGWRKNEMEVKVYFNNPSEKEILSGLHLIGDIYQNHALLYLIPSELEKVKSTGFEFEITKTNLNNYYKDFWKQKDAYHTYEEIIDLMDSLVTAFPDICTKTIFGSSVQGRELSALKISDNVAIDENEAEIMFDGGIHGDEIGAAENCIRFAKMLCLEYGNDPTITDLIDTREIWIFPMVNPDGRITMSRYNANFVDLNRDWGYMWDGWGFSTGAYSQTESKALRSCMLENQFNIHMTFHSGVQCFIYPWYYRGDPSPDDSANYYLGSLYSGNSGYDNLLFFQAFSMYPTNGTSAETYYGVMGSYGFTMEISSIKQPPPSMIEHYYQVNEPAMIKMIEFSGYGLTGSITDANTSESIAATIKINDFMPVYSDPEIGDYHKYVLPGTYSITVEANGYQSQTINNVNLSDTNSFITTDFQLQPDTGRFIYRIISCQIPDNNFEDEGNTLAILGASDSINYSIGKNGWVVIDMLDTIVDGPGNDIIVFEGDTSAEEFFFFASEFMDGPWTFLGTGTGTSEFNLLDGNINNVRYFKIQDDGDGDANMDNAGFDLDAIKAIENPSGVYLSLNNYSIIDTAANGNGRIDPGETVDLEIKLINNGDSTALNVEGIISSDSTYISMVQPNANFENIPKDDSASATFSFTANASVPNGQVITISLDLTSNNGAYNDSFEMEFIVGLIPVLIVNLDENANSGPVLKSTCDSLNIISEYLSFFPETTELYNSIFVCLGIPYNNHVLTSEEGILLAGYLENGGNLYMEGGNTWFNDEQTLVHPMFNINGIDDGSGSLYIIHGINGAFTHDMNFNYSGDNNSIDQLEAIEPAFLLFNNNFPMYSCAVAHDAGNYKTIGLSFEFGGLDDEIPPSTKEEYLQRILDFFDGIYT